ncbi:MAG: zinc ribbon domain-containing protein [Micromonosporaceae bacterium]
MKAAPDAQRRLLDVQAIDTSLAQLAHRTRNLPEHAELEKQAAQLQTLADDRAKALVAVDDLDRDIARLERDVDQVRQRAAKDQGRLDSGSGSPKELESLQHEIGTLARRQEELEDAELELMEQRESAQSQLDALDTQLAAVTSEQQATAERRDAAVAEITAEQQRLTEERVPLVASLPADLVTLYEKIRAQSNTGAAMLRAGRCEGCHLDLAGSDLATVKAAAEDEVVRCEECRRILVRTKESGL